MKSEETILNQHENENEETQLSDKHTKEQKEPREELTKKNRSWKQVVIGGVSGILLGSTSTFFTGSTSAYDDADAPGHGSQSSTSGEALPVSEDSAISVEGLPIATVSDDLSFSEAFAAARQEVGPGGVFEWNGGVYGTYYANEWNEMTAEERAEFGSRISYGTGGNTANNEDSNQNDTSTETISAETHTDTVPGGGRVGEDLVVNVEPENNETFDEVQIIGVHEATMEDGSIATIGQMEISGHEVFVVDVNHDGTFDIMGADMNSDGVISESEICNIQDEGIQVTDFQQQLDISPQDNYLAELPDYTNDAEPVDFA